VARAARGRGSAPTRYNRAAADQSRFWTEDQNHATWSRESAATLIAGLAITDPEPPASMRLHRTNATKSTAGTSSRLEDVSSTAACAPTSSLPRSRDGRGRATAGLWSFPYRPRTRVESERALEELGCTPPTRRDQLRRRVRARQNLLGVGYQGFYLIMANFQWERLRMAAGSCRVDAPGASSTGRRSTPAFERKAVWQSIGHFQLIRHKLSGSVTIAGRPRRSPTRRWAVRGGEGTRCASEMPKLATPRASRST